MRVKAVGVFALIFLVGIFVEACSHGSTSSTPRLSNVAQSPGPSRRAQSGASITVYGPIQNVWANGTQFQIKDQSPNGCGYLDVVEDSTTLIADSNGADTLTTGNYASVTGVGSCSTNVDPASLIVLAQATPYPQTTTLIGEVNSSIASGQFGMQTSITGGSGCGSIDVDVDANTVIVTNGQSIAANASDAEVFGTGSCATKMYAAQIILAPTSTPMAFAQPTTVAGPIQAVSGSGFQIQAPAGCGNVWVYQTPNPNPVVVANGQTLSVGTNAQVTASGTCGTHFINGKTFLNPASTPTPVPTPTNLASHVPIADRCCEGYEVDTPPASALPQVKTYVNAWVGPDAAGVAELNGAQITSNISAYADPALVRPGDVPSQEWSDVCGTATQNTGCSAGGGRYLSAAAKGDGPSGIVLETNTGAVLTDPWETGSNAALASWEDAIQIEYTLATSGNYDTMFLDDVGTYTSGSYNFSPAPYHSSSAWSEPAVSEAYASLINLLSISPLNAGQSQPKYILNAGIDSQYLGQLGSGAASANLGYLISPSSVTTIDCEGCWGDNGSSKTGEVYGGTQWVATENEAIQLVLAHKTFLSQQQDDCSTGQTSYTYRLYAYASFMLTWDPVYTLLQNDYYGYPGAVPCQSNTPPTIHVFPEEMLTAYFPTSNLSSTGISELHDTGHSPGAYSREFAACYYEGQLVGAGTFHGCAFIVNPNSSSASTPTLTRTYTHTMVISSATDVLSGGAVSLQGPAPSATLAPLTAEVALP